MTPVHSLREIQTAIIAHLVSHYGERVPTIIAWDPYADDRGQAREPITTPAILLGIEQVDSDDSDDDGSGRQAVRVYWLADCVLSARTTEVATEVADFARDVLRHIRHQRWGLQPAVLAPQGLSAQPAETVPELAGYRSWRVLWEQVAYLDADVWSGPDSPRGQLYLGFAPKIGRGHEQDYIPIDAAPEVTG